MKFTLTFQGPLPPCGNNRKPEEKWAIRQQISPQLADLWHCHPALQEIKYYRHWPRTGSYVWTETHHTAPPPTNLRTPQAGDVDLLEELQIEGYKFLPLVRKHMALVCSLHVLFMRQGQVGELYQDGDLDNRVKTLLDALRIPDMGEIRGARPTESKDELIYCLLEDDKYVTGVNIETRQLLNRRGASPFEVNLVVDVDIRITHPRAYNHSFLGD